MSNVSNLIWATQKEKTELSVFSFYSLPQMHPNPRSQDIHHHWA